VSEKMLNVQSIFSFLPFFFLHKYCPSQILSLRENKLQEEGKKQGTFLLEKKQRGSFSLVRYANQRKTSQRCPPGNKHKYNPPFPFKNYNK
jgi:hypothetical protein